ncbi:S41 family peptidase [Leptolyngbya sp. FACHB-261]|uniref:S41 family peptidase n=1 Tax=Leptolyngbya sp. FACHB-261 TaxID=2692806 RepID=UPI001682AF98|nr:S41 family peptidase [Leptolyngbya sp. FACHB-261]MBD2101220.1 S41 family peptidase [Leptolyngbya sp. FACHB-261]
MKRLRLARNASLATTLLITALVGLSILLGYGFSPMLSRASEPDLKVFEQVWQTVNDSFYDPNLKGVDWRAIRRKYEPQVRQARSKPATAAVINQMLAELKTSHTYFYTSDQPAYYQILGIFRPRSSELQQQLKPFFPNDKLEYSGIGIFTRDIDGKTFVSGVWEGSPAAEAGLRLGDQILNAEGRPFEPIQSFAGKAGQKVKLLIQRSPDLNSQREIAVTPKLLDATTMFLDAQKASTQVIERAGKKLGYVHIWSYASDQYQQQLEEDLFYGDLKDADALILDLREGWGGAPLSVLNIYTARGPSVTNIPRDRKRYTNRTQWNKPVVMLVNEGSRSAKEVLAYSFQQYKIGPVVGSKTAGAVVAGRPFLMSDGSVLYVAVADVYVDDDQRLEGVGVTPDVEVPLPLAYAQGADPQKERAIQVALETLQRPR